MLTDAFIEEWPIDEMSGLPDPGCVLISFNKDGTDQNAISTVEFANMTETEANKYVIKLKEAGFTPETEAEDHEKILFKGYDGNGNGVVFDYSVIYENGVISIIMKDAI